jgi:hypothetical protein
MRILMDGSAMAGFGRGYACRLKMHPATMPALLVV